MNVAALGVVFVGVEVRRHRSWVLRHMGARSVRRDHLQHPAPERADGILVMPRQSEHGAPIARRLRVRHHEADIDPDIRGQVGLVDDQEVGALYKTWARDFDLVVAEEYPGHAAAHYPELDRALLTTDQIRLAVPESNADRVTSIEDAAAMPWVMEPRGAASRHWAEQRCRQAGFEPDVRFETADLQAHIRLIESGHAVALLPDLVWSGRTQTVSLIELAGSPHRNIFTAARKASANTPAIVACRTGLAMAAATVNADGVATRQR